MTQTTSPEPPMNIPSERQERVKEIDFLDEIKKLRAERNRLLQSSGGEASRRDSPRTLAEIIEPWLHSVCSDGNSDPARLARSIAEDLTHHLRMAPSTPAEPNPPGSGERPLKFWYRNYRGEIAQRRVDVLGMRYGSSQYHPEPQWLLIAFDIDKQADREFAVKDMAPMEAMLTAAPLPSPPGSGEPVGWVSYNADKPWFTDDPLVAEDWHSNGWKPEPLYAAPLSSPSEGAGDEAETIEALRSALKAAGHTTADGTWIAAGTGRVIATILRALRTRATATGGGDGL